MQSLILSLGTILHGQSFIVMTSFEVRMVVSINYINQNGTLCLHNFNASSTNAHKTNMICLASLCVCVFFSFLEVQL